jgi:enoyl-CoA hydratase
VMAGESVTAEEALRAGFVHRVLPDEGFHEAVDGWVRKLVTNSAEALGLAKIAIDAAVDSDRRTARHIDRMANTQLLTTREHLDKLAAFTNRSKR